MAHHAMVWVVAGFSHCRPQTQTSLCVIYGGESGTGTVFSPSTSVFSCQYHPTNGAWGGVVVKVLRY
jgi:hypothetical protein